MNEKKPGSSIGRWNTLSTRILLSLVVGLACGAALSGRAPATLDLLEAVAAPIGQLWLDALTMTVVPLVFGLLVTGVGSATSSAAAGGVVDDGRINGGRLRLLAGGVFLGFGDHVLNGFELVFRQQIASGIFDPGKTCDRARGGGVARARIVDAAAVLGASPAVGDLRTSVALVGHGRIGGATSAAPQRRKCEKKNRKTDARLSERRHQRCYVDDLRARAGGFPARSQRQPPVNGGIGC